MVSVCVCVCVRDAWGRCEVNSWKEDRCTGSWGSWSSSRSPSSCSRCSQTKHLDGTGARSAITSPLCCVSRPKRIMKMKLLKGNNERCLLSIASILTYSIGTYYYSAVYNIYCTVHCMYIARYWKTVVRVIKVTFYVRCHKKLL